MPSQIKYFPVGEDVSFLYRIGPINVDLPGLTRWRSFDVIECRRAILNRLEIE
jgi:hypothetical protein